MSSSTADFSLFEETFRIFPITLLHRQEYNYGGKVLLPPSVLHKLADEHFDSNSPLLFKLTGHSRDGMQKYTTHCGVLEFIADEGRIYAPEWMMNQLHSKGGASVHVELCSLPKGTFIKIQPQSVDFLDILDPRGALENALRMFSTLTKGDLIQFRVGEKVFEIEILEVQPDFEEGAICIHEIDLNVDFAPPVGYVEPEPAPVAVKNMEGFVNKLAVQPKQSEVFRGTARKLNNAPVTEPLPSNSSSTPARVKLPEGRLFIPRQSKSQIVETSNETKLPFQGASRKLS